ncbi:hypothetical protein [Macrococcus sp. DPC7161]|uniref:hypothetical protein n=1 Tax=Macrococcus sp. DPC7161 TaxID=2507060 RepID=UPI00100BFF86|nr:hypothetical protein [Macrococcus sp. DPC7161]RXK18254.1 hypothetical protein ER639_06065 [Macrococcus sp. DPC7161]
MDYKVIGSTLIATTLLLGACGNNDDTKKEEKSTTETKTSVTKEDNKKKESSKAEKAKEKIKQSKENNNETSNEVPSNEIKQPEKIENTVQQININNITSRADLEKIIYGNYSEIDKVTAYNNAVQNGIIPQGNVMEGSAVNAYESSLRVESGQEKSVYRSNPYPDNPAASKYDHLYKSSNAADDIDSNNDSNSNASSGLTSGEIQTKYAIEQGYYDGPNAQEVYNAIIEKEKALQNQ